MLKPVALRAFEETFRVQAQKTAELSKRALIETAERVRNTTLAEQRSRAGVAPDYTQIVDRVRDAPLNAVRPDGTIIFEWVYLREVAEVAFDTLLARGPQLSGAWKKSLSIFVDDVKASLEAITPATQRIEIAPVIIYARRLELGKDRKGGPFVVNAPPHLVEETAVLLRRQYARVARVQHTFVQLQADTAGMNAKARAAAKAAVRYPAIMIRPLVA